MASLVNGAGRAAYAAAQGVGSGLQALGNGALWLGETAIAATQRVVAALPDWTDRQFLGGRGRNLRIAVGVMAPVVQGNRDALRAHAQVLGTQDARIGQLEQTVGEQRTQINALRRITIIASATAGGTLATMAFLIQQSIACPGGDTCLFD